MSLAERYAELCRTPSDMQPFMGILTGLVIDSQAQTVVELGVRTGNSTIALLFGLEQTGGQLWSCDIDDPPAIDHPAWHFVQGNDVGEIVVSQLPETFDLCFIDTTHTYEQTMHELEVYESRLSVGGIMVMHDSELLVENEGLAVRTAICGYYRDRPVTIEYHTEWPGLAVVRGGPAWLR